MSQLSVTRRHLVVVVLPLLAAVLACGGLTPSVATPDAALTQAAVAGGALGATAQAAASTAQAVAPTAAPLATQLSAIEAEATQASATATALAVAGSGAATQPPPANGAAIDPCSLMTVDEASAIVSEPAGQPQRLGQACVFYDPATTSTGMGLYVLPASQAQDFLGRYVPALQANGITLDQTAVDKLTQDITAGDMPAAVNDLLGLTTGIPGYEIKKLNGVGDAALWSWHTVDQNNEGALIAAKPGALVAVIVAGTPTTQETVAQPAMVAVVKRILANLPANFTIATTP